MLATRCDGKFFLEDTVTCKIDYLATLYEIVEMAILR